MFMKVVRDVKISPELLGFPRLSTSMWVVLSFISKGTSGVILLWVS